MTTATTTHIPSTSATRPTVLERPAARPSLRRAWRSLRRAWPVRSREAGMRSLARGYDRLARRAEDAGRPIEAACYRDCAAAIRAARLGVSPD